MSFLPESERAGSLDHALIVRPELASEVRIRSREAALDEARGLAEAIALKVVGSACAPVTRPAPATFMGSGKVDEITERLNLLDPRPGIVIVDAQLSPVQHRNLEKAWNAKVLDRTALILEIFGARAKTAEGRLQVELAHLTFQRSRLVRSWTHLERQRGGSGFLGGPGERQIESDRRALANQIDRLKSKLENVRRTRSLQRAKRKRAPHPVVALVGYTNAGKSTLFNRLTASSVIAKDLLFATLDPTMRAIDLSSGQRIILSDTVGFISDLPTQLVAAFRATLEEVLEADIIVHVRDIAHADTAAQRIDVVRVLGELGIGPDDERPFIEVFNKMDLLDADARMSVCASARLSLDFQHPTIDEPACIPMSSITGEGVEEFLAVIDALATADRTTIDIDLPSSEGAARAWLFSAGDVIAIEQSEGGERLKVRLSEKSLGQFGKLFPAIGASNDAIEAARRTSA